MAARYDYVFADTEDVVIEARWTDVSGAAYTLTSAAMTATGTVDGEAVTVDAEVASVGSGWRTYTIEHELLAVGEWKYDVLVTRNDDLDKVLAHGTITIRAGVTQHA